MQLGSTAGVGQLGCISQIQNMLKNQNQEAYKNSNQGNRSSFLGTLKGGHGIMGNISNNEDEPIYDGINNGIILNIENVLNQLNNKNELLKD